MLRRIVLIVAGVLMFVVGEAAPAFAHNTGGVSATNYKSVLDSFKAPAPGVKFFVKELGNQLQVENPTATELDVLGYSGEPYLRVSKSGVFVNRNSPSYFVNQSLTGADFVPPTATPQAAPDWRKQSSADLATWHDHRAHWVASKDPVEVANSPHKDSLVIPNWTIEMRYGGKPLVAMGHLSYIAPRSAVPWFGLAAAMLLFGLALSLLKRSTALIASALLGLIIIDIVHTVGLGVFVAGTTWTRVSRAASAVLPSAVAWTVGLYGVRRLFKGFDDGPWYAVFAACLICVLGGVSDIESLTRSQVPFTWAPWIDRAAVSISLGLGAALFVGLIVMILRQRKSMGTSIDKVGA